MPKCPWLLHQTVSLPSADQEAVAFWGSMYPWWTVWVRYSRSTITSAASNPLSRSPNVWCSWPATLGIAEPSDAQSSWSQGASGFMASSTLVTAGSGSYSTSISDRASSAACGLAAATAATGWPL